MNAQVNRWLKNKDMDHIDHALGRPVDPLNKSHSYRDHFALSNDDKIAEFRASPNWTEGASGHGTTFFHVSDEGRAALAAHLKEIGDKHRLFEVIYAPDWSEKPEANLVAAKSRGAAKYAYWIDLSDSLCDLTFKDYCKDVSVRLAQ